MVTSASGTVTSPSGFGAWLTQTLGALPYIVSGIEQIHANASGETKKQIALNAVGLAVGAGETIAPEIDPAVAAATTLISATIDGVKAVYNAAKGISKNPTGTTGNVSTTAAGQ